MSTLHVQGFKALPVKYRSSCKSNHWLYCKEHSVREKSTGKPAGRTIFIINVPPYFTKECLEKLFAECGEITAIYFHQKPTSSLPPEEKSKFFPVHPPIKGFKVAYVVFASSEGLKKFHLLNWTEPAVIWDSKTKLPTAIDKWKSEYDNNIPKLFSLQEDIDNFMLGHDQKIEGEEKERREAEGQPDEEGWVTVTKRGRKPGFSRKESLEQKLMAKEKKKKSKKELLNFYSFQIRESKMKHLAELRSKFEEDKKKITQLRQSRKFKPF